MTSTKRKKIAVIGTGISGLGIASLLHPHHDITVFEKNNYIGGHSRTVEARTTDGKVIPVDTGFIVFNKKNYPLLTRLFEYLNVPIVKSDMSFGASIHDGWLEYGSRELSCMFAQKRNIFRPRFWGMIRDILKFNKNAKKYLLKDTSYTLGQCLDDMGTRPWFRNYFLLAMGGAIWSTPVAEMLKFPAQTFIRFFENHGLLTVDDHPQWYTVQGGSHEYVHRLIKPFNDKIHLDRGVKKVQRTDNGIIIEDSSGKQEIFDEVVFACHADQALRMIEEPHDNEKKILSSFRYQPNRAVLHSDPSFMPKRRKAWASWVYLSRSKSDTKENVSLSYWMNNLQPLATNQDLIVTLNPGHAPSEEKIHDDYLFEHPVFDAIAINSQNKINTIQGQNRFWFCGAYQRYGFHEDGLLSAVKVASQMGITTPW